MQTLLLLLIVLLRVFLLLSDKATHANKYITIITNASLLLVLL